MEYACTLLRHIGKYTNHNEIEKCKVTPRDKVTRLNLKSQIKLENTERFQSLSRTLLSRLRGSRVKYITCMITCAGVSTELRLGCERLAGLLHI